QASPSGSDGSSSNSTQSKDSGSAEELIDFQPLLESLCVGLGELLPSDPERQRRQHQNLCTLMQESYATHVIAAMFDQFVAEPVLSEEDRAAAALQEEQDLQRAQRLGPTLGELIGLAPASRGHLGTTA